MTFANRWRRVVILFAFLSLICVAVTSRSAQSKNPRRVTALQLGDAAEGSRVTIVSDSALNDYEAFRRGDRFYVRIPLADFTAAPPSFRSHGFEDVRVQEVGNDVVVSFKLQPGASARVDQRSNRLEVVFSAFRGSRTVTPANSYPTTRTRRNTGGNTDAIVGPMPPASPSRSITRNDLTGRTNYPASPREYPANSSTPARRSNRSAPRSVVESEAEQNRKAQALRGNTSTRGTTPESATGPGSMGNSPTQNLPPQPKPSFAPPTSSPGTAGPVSPVATPTPVSTPAAFATPMNRQPASAPVSVTPGTAQPTSWDSRIKFLKVWARLNQSALIFGALLALALFIGVIFWSRLKRKGTAKGKAAQRTSSKTVSEKAGATHARREGDQEREVFEL